MCSVELFFFFFARLVICFCLVGWGKGDNFAGKMLGVWAMLIF